MRLIIETGVYALMIVGAIVGIGFVSGKEIVSFFFKYYNWSIVLCGLSSMLLFIILFVMVNKGDDTHNNVINQKNKKCNNQNITVKNNTGNIIQGNKIVVFKQMCNGCFQVVISGCMLAGICSLLSVIFDNLLLEFFIKLVVVFLLFLLLSRSVNIVSKISSFITFGLIIIMIINVITWFNFRSDNIVVNQIISSDNNFISGVWSIIFYVSMNILSCSGVVSVIKNNIKSKTQKNCICFLASVILFLLILSVILLYKNSPNVTYETMPLLSIALSVDYVWYVVYYVLLFIGCFCSIYWVAYSGFTSFGGDKRKDKIVQLFLMLFVVFLVSNLGFDFLIDKIYPLIGALNLITFFIVFLFKIVFLQNKKAQNNHN